MTQKQRDKHIADNAAEQKKMLEGNEVYPVATSPDELGTYEGGRAELLGSKRWVSQKSHPQRTGDTKNTPGIDYASKITQRQQKDFNEISMVDGKVMLYNAKTDAWDIEGTTDDMPYYVDENDLTWAYNNKTGVWDVPVICEEFSDVNPEVVG